ncbi:MAG: DUF3107 domain-containing protein [Propionibacteriaceae bacterium]|nr:DUF3107 domain-containing protein [Propionibacteriaceae bacterium]
MEVKVGIQNHAREVVIASADAAADIEKSLSKSLADDSVLKLTDAKGRIVLVPANAIAYIDIAEEESRQVGFGRL